MVEADPPTQDLYQVLVIDPGFKRRWRSFKEKGAEYYCPISQPDLILESEKLWKISEKYFRFTRNFVPGGQPPNKTRTFQCQQGVDMTQIPWYYHRLICEILFRHEPYQIFIKLDGTNDDCGLPEVQLSLIVAMLLGVETKILNRKKRNSFSPISIDLTDGSDLHKISKALGVEDTNLSGLFTNQVNLREYISRFINLQNNKSVSWSENYEEFETTYNKKLQELNLMNWAEQIIGASERYRNIITQGILYAGDLNDLFSKDIRLSANVLYGQKSCDLIGAEIYCRLSLPEFSYNSENDELEMGFFGEKSTVKESFVFKCVPKSSLGTSERNQRVLLSHSQSYDVVQLDNGRIIKKDDIEKYSKQFVNVQLRSCFFNQGREGVIASCRGQVIIKRNKNPEQEVIEPYRLIELNYQDFPAEINGFSVSLEAIQLQIYHSNTKLVARELYTGESNSPTSFIAYLELQSDNSWSFLPNSWASLLENRTGYNYVTISASVLSLITLLLILGLCYKCVPKIKEMINWSSENRVNRWLEFGQNNTVRGNMAQERIPLQSEGNASRSVTFVPASGFKDQSTNVSVRSSKATGN